MFMPIYLLRNISHAVCQADPAGPPGRILAALGFSFVWSALFSGRINLQFAICNLQLHEAACSP